MTANDIKVIKGAGATRVYEVEDRTDSGTSYTLKPGEPLKESGNYMGLIATGDPELGTDVFSGITRKESTETSTVDGKVEVITLNPGRTVLRGDPTTSTNIDTASELIAVMLNNVCFDLTASTGTNGIFTIDEDEADDPNVHGLKIVDGDIDSLWLDVIPNVMTTEHAPYV